MSSPDQRPVKRKQLAAPKGTRDFYPEDLLRRRYIEKAWRDTSIRHGFEEIEGPTFETADLYKVKSGEGILGEMFGVFSGKAEEDLKHLRETGEAPLALRPEFTPTLARMYAARAAQLPKPTKWFTAGPYFRAEKPQRGRLREFCQWNCDIVGGGNEPEAQTRDDADLVACCVGALDAMGLASGVKLCLNDRRLSASLLRAHQVDEEAGLQALDRVAKLPEAKAVELCHLIGLDLSNYRDEAGRLSRLFDKGIRFRGAGTDSVEVWFDWTSLRLLRDELQGLGIADWAHADLSIARGLAYYTGMVFEAIAEGERAVCGGGRYDNLIELFGGPPTPAVGFGMGDVVLGNLLQDKGLMPEGPALLEALSAPAASLRPDVFVISNGSEEADAQVRPLVARLRRGQESEAWLARERRKPWDRDRYTEVGSESRPTRAARPLHARHSYKATKNIGKLLEDARKSSARFAAIIENAEECSLKNLDTGEQRERVKLADLAAAVTRA